MFGMCPVVAVLALDLALLFLETRLIELQCVVYRGVW